MIRKILACALLPGILLCVLSGCGVLKTAGDSPSPAEPEAQSVYISFGGDGTDGGSDEAPGDGASADANPSSGGESDGGQEASGTETVYGEDGSYSVCRYDGDGNLLQADCYGTDGSFLYRRDYEYDANGNRTRQYTDGVIDFRMGYDGLGRTVFEVDYDENGHLQRYWEFSYGEDGHFAESHIEFRYCEGQGYGGGDLAYGTRGELPAVDVYFYPEGEVQRIVWYGENGKYDRERDTFYEPEDTPSGYAESGSV